ncbi:type IV secretory system conjugative DNA transfer family protein [Streptomyces sp. NPDC059063]|uniref:type IV secretory system conjugative DNA transfer family protein n=1 Tax=unclassified Streptomyces TaxID=2593676 RepID=UPI00367DDEA1
MGQDRHEGPDRRYDDRRGRPTGGVPDGLLVGVLAFLLGMVVLMWSATGIAAWWAHGEWPDQVSFSNTPTAVRHLIQQPHDVAGAWPDTPKSELSGYGLLWGFLIGQIMVLIVLAIFVLGTVARFRAGRRIRREEQAGVRDHEVPAPKETADTAKAVETAAPTVAPEKPTVPAVRPNAEPADAVPAVDNPRDAAADADAATAVGNRPAGRVGPPLFERSRELGEGWAQPTAPGAPNPDAAPTPPLTKTPTVPTPRTPLVLGTPETRRPLAAQAIADAESAALVVTSDPTLWEETKDARSKLGPVLVYDPSHLCDTPARLHWSPTAGCEDNTTATHRARALLAPIRPSAKLDTAVADTAETLLRTFLHAAAVDGRSLKHVHRWAQGTQVQEAVRILRTHPKASSGAAGELESALTAYTERRDIAQELTARALSSLFTVNVRESCTPNRGDALALDSFVDEGGTLFVVGEPIEDPKTNPGAMPLLTALASSVVERGRRMAERSSSGRLDPPMTLVLDDIAAVAPLPQLPELLATGPDRGMPTLALLRSREQGRARWPHDELRG